MSLFVGALGALTTEYLQFGKFYETLKVVASAFFSPRKDTSYEAAGTAKLEKCLGPVHVSHMYMCMHMHVCRMCRERYQCVQR